MTDIEPDEIDAVPATADGLEDGETPAADLSAADVEPSTGWVCQCVCDNPGVVHR